MLARITGELGAAARSRDADHAGFVRALSRNLEFWTIVGADVANQNNQLSADLRARLFFLFEFTRAHTHRLLGGDRAVNAEPLLEINRNILAGLRCAGDAAEGA